MKTLLSIATLGALALSYSGQASAAVHTIAIKKVNESPEATLQRYANTGSYISQKYFGAGTLDKFSSQQGEVIATNVDGSASFGVPISNFMNA
ncbi:aspartic proteinase precursor, partial [Kickxella alabastrina]